MAGTRLRKYLLAICALAALSAAPAERSLRAWTQAGIVNQAPASFIVGHQSMECRFQPIGPKPPYAYEGVINTVGPLA